MSEELKKDLEEVFENLEELGIEELLLARGFSLGLRAANEMKTEQPQSVKN